MEINNKYQAFYDRIQNGERDMDIAKEAGHSVDALYNRFVEYGILNVKKRRTEEEWDEAYQNYLAGKSVIHIARDLDVKVATVYNHFASRGYKVTERKPIDRTEFFQDYENGFTLSELATKYKYTLTHIRHLLRRIRS
jgi:DNA-directed RNA polymerase specialized sigma24 family protein